jgi:hypothetical protein
MPGSARDDPSGLALFAISKEQRTGAMVTPARPIAVPAGRGRRPADYLYAPGACWQPQTKGITVGSNSIYNNWRMEDVWLDK